MHTLRHSVNLGRADLSLVVVAPNLCKLFIFLHIHEVGVIFGIFRRLRITIIGLELIPKIGLPKVW